MTTRTTNHKSEEKTSRQDIYTRVTDKIVADLEQGVRPWMKPWNAEHAAGKITRPLRHNGTPYSGINILMLWMAASAIGFSAPIWMTYRQAVGGGQCAQRREGLPGRLCQFHHPHGNP
ncbi:MAG: ArdC-like ssDNA-binding domain-containing protein [Nitrospirales bacterium]|nr:ArdC family protein [Nitrospirales bacterium]